MRRLVVAAAFIVMAVVGTVVFWPDGSSGDGPVEDGGEGLVMASLVDVGQVVSFGHIMLSNYGKEPAVIERVRVVGATGPLELLGVQARPIPNPRGQFLNQYGFPPTGYPGRPLKEENVVPVASTLTEAGTPEERLQLVIGVRATTPGVARAQGVEVAYKVGKVRYQEIFLNEFYLCAPRAEYRTEEGCPPGELENQFDDRVLEAR